MQFTRAAGQTHGHCTAPHNLHLVSDGLSEHNIRRYIELDEDVAAKSLGCDMRPAADGGDVVCTAIWKCSP